MINIISDSTLLLHSFGEKCISSKDEYPNTYMDILEALDSQKDFTVIIQTYVITQWFLKMASRYPQGTFSFITIDARGALSKSWGVEIPETVTNEDIMQTGLLSADIHPQPGFSFEDTMLAHYYAPILMSKTFPLQAVAILIGSC